MRPLLGTNLVRTRAFAEVTRLSPPWAVGGRLLRRRTAPRVTPMAFSIVRILPQSERDIGIKLLGIVHYQGEAQTITVDNVDEAERVLPR